MEIERENNYLPFLAYREELDYQHWPPRLPYGGLSSKPTPDWFMKWKNSAGGATLAAPDIKAARYARETLDRIRWEVRNMDTHGREAGYKRLHEFYLQETALCRDALTRVYQLYPEHHPCIIFDTNGTTALSHIRHAIDFAPEESIVTTDDTGHLSVKVLEGDDPWNHQMGAIERIGLFTDHRPRFTLADVAQRPDIRVVTLREEINRFKPNTEIYQLIESELREQTARLLVIPRVSKVGRVLPVREIGRLVKEINQNRDRGRRLIYVIDDVQALGRMPADEMKNPLEYADYVICTSGKALGGVQITSAILAREDRIVSHIKTLVNSPYLSHIGHYQYPFNDYLCNRIDRHLFENKVNHALSLPEISAFGYALNNFYGGDRRNDSHFVEKVGFITSSLWRLRTDFAEKLSLLPGVHVYSGQEDAPIVPSIVTFRIDHSRLTASQIREALKTPSDAYPSFVLSGVVDDTLLRVELRGYQTSLDQDMFCKKLRMILNQ